MCYGRNYKGLLSFVAAGVLLLIPPLSLSAADKSKKEVGFAVFSLNNEMPPLSKSKTRMLYKGRTKKLHDSITVALVDLPETSILREKFYKMLLGKSISQMNGYWASLSFSGKGTPPKQLDSDDIQAILEWLNQNPNGIAYAPVEAVPESANILITIIQGE